MGRTIEYILPGALSIVHTVTMPNYIAIRCASYKYILGTPENVFIVCVVKTIVCYALLACHFSLVL